LIQGGWVIGSVGQEHRLIQDGVVVFDENNIIHVGKSFSGQFDEKIDARRKIISPGFINTHCHMETPINSSAFSIDEDCRLTFANPSIPYLPTWDKLYDGRLSEENFEDIALYSLCALLKSGCTTIVEVGAGRESLVKLVGKLGIRAYLGPGFRSAEPYTGKDGTYYNKDWSEERGLKGLEEAKKFIERFDGAHNHRVKGILVPSQVDNCTPQLLKEVRKTANDMEIKIATHAGQRVFEFHEIIRKYKKTPIGFLDEVGLLGPDLIIGHANIVTGHSWAGYPGDDDVVLLARKKANVAHCPFVSARISWVFESFNKYSHAGVNITLGTDTWPMDIINEMRWASLLCKIVEKDSRAAPSIDVYNAATLNSAKAVGRQDIGMLSKGRKADIVIIDVDNLRYAPIYNPIKSLVNAGTSDDIDTVIIDGKLIVEEKKMINVNEKEVIKNANRIAKGLWARIPEWDWANRKIEDIDSKSFKPFNE
jgi:cytosine/adenosine deaminase-related metal-dependent hydrolase